MAKTTKQYINSVSDTVQFQNRNTIQDVEIKGKTALADVTKKGNVLELKLNADGDKADKTKVYTKEEVNTLIARMKEEIITELRG